MSPSSPVSQVHRFPGWEIRPQERVLLIDGKPARLGSRAFDLLVALAERPARVVSRRELMDLVWPDVVVEENNLSVQITALRKLLGAGAVVNVSGIGYQLAALPESLDLQSLQTVSIDAVFSDPELVGRDAELAALAPRVGSVPLLSIVGTGGVGKTALAQALLARQANAWRDGVHWIDLTAVQRGVPLLPLVSRSLGVLPDEDGLVSGDVWRSLSGLRALIALDNCEHVLDAVVECLAPLLRAAPGLRWLTTSQEPLRLTGEEVHRLGPLQVIPPDADPTHRQSCSAMSLFVQRAYSSDLDFEQDDRSVAMTVDICRALDGLPLALEIAAAQVATLGLRGVHEQLDRRLSLRNSHRDAPQRHHTLRDTYAWSHGLLADNEQRLFRRLQPFQGGFTLPLAQGMARPLAGEHEDFDADSPADTLQKLLAKSLVQRLPAGPPGELQRYRLLESARDFAALQLGAAGESDAVLRRHAEVVAAAFESAWDELLTSRDSDWSNCYLAERENVLAALAWVRQRDEPTLMARLVMASVQIASFRDTAAEAAAFAVPLDVLRQAPAALRARAFVELGWAHFLHGSRELGKDLIEQALADSETVGDVACAHLSLTRLIRLYRGRPGQADGAQALWARMEALDASRVPLRLKLYCQSTVGRYFGVLTTLGQLQQLAEIATQAGYELQAGICLTNLTDELLVQGRFEEVEALAQSLLQSRPNQIRLRAFVSYNRAHALVRLGRPDEARGAALSVLRAMPGQAHTVIDLFALAATKQARWQDAALMVGCSARIKRDRDFIPEPAEAALIEETLCALRRSIAQSELERFFDFGASMVVTDVLALAGLSG